MATRKRRVRAPLSSLADSGRTAASRHTLTGAPRVAKSTRAAAQPAEDPGAFAADDGTPAADPAAPAPLTPVAIEPLVPLADGSFDPTAVRSARTRRAATAAADLERLGAARPDGVVAVPQPRIVGIGASAGGLEALRDLVRSLAHGDELAVVVVQHLSPAHRSMLVELLAREASLPVVEIVDGMVPVVDTIHVTPSSVHVRLVDGRLRLTRATRPGTPKPSIDDFLSSLADERGGQAIGVILSGTGHDGQLGVRRLNAVGGMTIVQDPQTCRYDGMPRAALETDCVTHVLSPQDIGRRLGELARVANGSGRAPAAEPAAVDAPPLERIAAMVRRETGFEIGLYKAGTFGRRLKRRMLATGSSDEGAYADFLQRHPTEVTRLMREMLISVTTFFRDAAAFKVLSDALHQIVERRPDGEELRIWVPGCATGEEAYGIAMLLAEAQRNTGRRCGVRVFATDLDAEAIAKARRGIYPTSALKDVPAEWRTRYLVHGDGEFRVQKALRDRLIFSVHNLIGDPPFLRLDLVSCRNVLIYLRNTLQTHLLESFHHALNPGGLLFLGKSESITQNPRLFTARDERARLYAKVLHRDAAGERAMPVRPAGPMSRAPVPVRAIESLADRMLRALIGPVVPPSVLVDESLAIRHVFGDVSPFVKLGDGAMSSDLYRMALRGLRVETRSLVLRVQRDQPGRVAQVVRSRELPYPVRIAALRLPGAEGVAPGVLVSFEALPAEPASETRADGDRPEGVPAGHQVEEVMALEEQLTTTRESLHTVIEELETSNEELQSLNEELQSSNEELQSSNEELETANEELQSTNEELTTVNDELESKTQELLELNSALTNVKNSLGYPLVVVDTRGRIVLFNSRAHQMFRLTESSIGESLFGTVPLLDVGDLARDVAEVIATGEPAERQIEGGECTYLLRAQPYLGPDGHQDGVVLMFVENTHVRSAELALRAAGERLAQVERFQRATLDALPEEVCVIDGTGTIVNVNRRWSELLEAGNGSVDSAGVGANYVTACERAEAGGDLSAAEFLAGLREVMSGAQTRFVTEYPCDTPFAGTRWYLAMVTAFDEASGRHCVVAHVDITVRKQQEARLQLQAMALDASVVGVVIADGGLPDLPLVYANEGFERLTGYSRTEVLGRNCRFMQGDYRDQPGLVELRAALAERREATVLLRNIKKDGSPFWNELTLLPVHDGRGRLLHVVGVQHDVTERVEAEERLRTTLQREQLAFSFADLGTFEWHVRTGLLHCSPIMLRLLHLAEDHGTVPLLEFRRIMHADDRNAFDDALKLCLAGHAHLDIEYRIHRSDGAMRWLHTRGDLVPDDETAPRRVLCLSHDITDRREAEAQARFIAHHDPLTGLPNRSLLNDRLQLALSTARRERRRVAVAFMDLDRFKEINDSLGHHVGDGLLKSVAQRLTSRVRETDTVCRVSGDEFILLLPGVHDEGEVARVAGKVHEALALPYLVDGNELHVTASIGLALFPDDGDSIDVLLRNADAAMYHAKGRGRNAFQFFSPEMNAALVERLDVANALRSGVRDDQLVLHYQPQVDISSGRLVGIEALVRWRRPGRGLVSPDVFIPVAEDSDLIHVIGEWVLREACLQNRRWQDAGLPKVPIAVNVSPAQFRQRNLTERVAAAISDSGLKAEYLELEITERVLTHNDDLAASMLGLLHRMGVSLAIDDFGTGYSSLTYLHRFPIDKLKIDRSFVAAAPGDTTAGIIVRSVVNLGHGLGLRVVAEGVEDERQLAFLRSEGCRVFQGYLVSRPLPADAFAALLASQPALCMAAPATPPAHADRRVSAQHD